MAKSNSSRLLVNNNGQSLVEYILLMAVLTSIAFAFYNNNKFKDLIKGTDGMFATMKKGMSYSYRYGMQYNSSTSFEESSTFEYSSPKHELYFNQTEGKSRFFSSEDAYP